MLNFEEIYSLPETQIQALVNAFADADKSIPRDGTPIVKRYLATIYIAKTGNLRSEDYQCASNPRFQALYLDDSSLVNENTDYISKFDLLRRELGCTTICAKDGIRQAINKYGRNLLRRKIDLLVTEFGSNAFNPEYIAFLYELIDVPMIDKSILSSLAFYTLVKERYLLFESQLADGIQWRYIKCLLNVLQSHPETRTEHSNMP